MRKQMFFLSCAALVYSISNNSFSGEASEMQLLNSQIQAQLQQMQEKQQKQMQDMNSALQGRMSDMQKNLQDEIEKVNNNMLKIQSDLQKQIQQVQASIRK